MTNEEIEAMVEKLGKKKAAPKKKASKPKLTVEDPNVGATGFEDTHSAVHIYQREGEPEGIVRSYATRERQMQGPGTLVFQHLHRFGGECTPACKVKVAES